MEIKFYNAAGTCLFVRDDMEDGHWTQEEMSVNATFPFDADKIITRGMRILFADPATGDNVMFEIRHITNTEPDHYQQIIAESVVISELSDEHINQTEITDKTPTQALTTVLTGTLWTVGNVTASNVSSCDISRGSVWQAIGTIQTNWNVYVEPRITLNTSGSISGRYLDIKPAGGTWRGLRLSIDKNMTDAAVTYDDTEVLTALYGYGGSVEVNGEQTELTFADEVWTATDDHPAKPAGQTYIEDPDATALYGRNGRARFGYYQNGDIDDAEVLLEKTWEALKLTSSPKISISGTVTDLYRLGYHDEPLRLHDTAIVEIRETGETFQKEIIRLDIDLLNPDANRPEIGDYIPNIIYINRDTADRASGGGGGGGRGQTNVERERLEFHTEIEANNYEINLRATQEDMDTVENIISKAGLSVNAQGVLIYAETESYMLGSKFRPANIIASINNQTGSSSVKISADAIDIDGVETQISGWLGANDVTIGWLEVTNSISAGACEFTTVNTGSLVADAGVSCDTLTVGEYGATWKTYTIKHATGFSAIHYFLYSAANGNTTPTGTAYGYMPTGYADTVINFLGRN